MGNAPAFPSSVAGLLRPSSVADYCGGWRGRALSRATARQGGQRNYHESAKLGKTRKKINSWNAGQLGGWEAAGFVLWLTFSLSSYGGTRRTDDRGPFDKLRAGTRHRLTATAWQETAGQGGQRTEDRRQSLHIVLPYVTAAPAAQRSQASDWSVVRPGTGDWVMGQDR
jgi:hypothetical protein